MTINIKEEFRKYKELKKEWRLDEAFYLRTKILREYYFENRLAALDATFQKLVMEERMDLIEYIHDLSSEDLMQPDTFEESPFSKLNTLFLIKIEKDAEIPMPETTGFLYEEEAILLSRTHWQKGAEKFIHEKLQNPDLAFYSNLAIMASNIESKISGLSGLSEAVNAEEVSIKEYEFKVDRFIQQADNETLPDEIKQLLEELLLVFIAVHFREDNFFEVKYYFEKLMKLIDENHNLYWTLKFFEKELIIDQTIY